MLKELHKRLKKIWAKICYPFDLFLNKGIDSLFDWRNEIADKENKYHCKKCKTHLSVIRMGINARGLKPGDKYNIKCLHCGNINIVIKGEK